MQRLFKALYFAGILAQIVVRFPFVRQHRQTAKVDQRVTTTERGLLLVMTVGMFFLPATYSLTRWLDFANYRWSPRSQARAGGAGAVLLAAAPRLMRALTVLGTAAMFLVGGGILVHGVPALGHGIEGWLAQFGGVAAALGSMLANLVIGVIAGAVVLAAVEVGKKLFGRKGHGQAAA